MGKPQFFRATTVESLSNTESVFIDLTTTATIPAGGDELVTIFSPAGTISRIVGMELSYPYTSGMVAGEREIGVTSVNGKVGITLARIPYNNTATLAFTYGSWQNATEQFPTSGDMLGYLQNLIFDESNALVIAFRNNQDKTSTGTRKILLHVEQTRIA